MRQAVPSGAAARAPATSAGGLVSSIGQQQARRGDQAAPAHVLGERREVQAALDAGAGHEGALGLDPVEQAAGDEAVDGLAHGGARDVVGRHQLALGRDRRPRGRGR